MKRHRETQERKRAGFTLVELMVVVVIIGLLATIATIKVMGYLDQAKRTRAKADISKISEALDLWRLKKSRYPTTNEGLEVLTQPLPGSKEPIMATIPKDPWGNPYEYSCPVSTGAFDIISYGPDGVQSDDDINSWELQKDQAEKP